MLMDGQGTKCRRKNAENYNRLSRAHERFRQTTDRRQTDDRQMFALFVHFVACSAHAFLRAEWPEFASGMWVIFSVTYSDSHWCVRSTIRILFL